MGSIHEEHMKWVQKLMASGETVLQPEYGEPMGNIQGYIKTQLPHKDAGAIFQDKNGAFGLFEDMGALHVTGLDWDNLGLCDSKCWYEWMSPETYQPKKGEEKVEVDGLSSETRAALAIEQDRSLKLSEVLDKQLKALIELRNMVGPMARTVYLDDEVIAGLHKAGIASDTWSSYINQAALRRLSGPQAKKKG